MSEIKHTPTWCAYESAGFKGQWGVETDDPAKVATGDEIIVYPNLSEADARLIAAAPDLLTVAKECIDLAKLAESLCGCRGDDDYVWGIQERLNAAIAKAEGRT